MLRIFTALIIASTLFVVGAAQLIAIRNNNEYSPLPHTALESEPVCDEASYLDVGNSGDVWVEADMDDPAKKVEPQNQELRDDDFLVIHEGQSLYSILRPQRISEQEIARLSLAFRPHLLAKDLAAGDAYQFKVTKINQNTALLDHFTIRKLDPNRLPIVYHAKRLHLDVDDPKFQLDIKTPNISHKHEFIVLNVKGTLYQTFKALPFGNELMQRLMEVFAWEMRLPEDVNQGDRIEMLVTKKYALDEFIGYGKLESVYYIQKTRTLFAIVFKSKDKKIKGIFDENGRSLEKEFAYAPVEDAIATSHQKWRRHPTLKILMRHNGIDYRGKDFFSIADGTIVEKRYDENVGNMIRIKHNYGVHSEYFHADSLENLSVGQRVKRGQILGTIGRTGRLCTGPHLHAALYRLHNGKRKFIELSSLRKILKPAVNVDKDHLKEFKEHLGVLVAQMQRKLDSIVAESHPSKGMASAQ